MVRLKENKHSTEDKPIERLPEPQKVFIPLAQNIGGGCEPLVKAGDEVFLGQKIGDSQAKVSCPVHASIAGVVIAIQDYPHPALGRCKAVVIEKKSGQETQGRQAARTQAEVDKLSPAQMRGIIREAGVVGMGGACFPTCVKLSPPKAVDALIVNGAECEPYLTGDSRLMTEKAGEIIKGIGIVQRCIGAKNVYIAIEDNKPEAIEAFKNELRVILRRAQDASKDAERSRGTSYELKVLKSVYPQGGEKQLIKNILHKEIPSGKLPFDIGALVHNVATCFAIYEAVYLNKPLYERVVTVSGDCVANPKNLLARIGTPIKDLIEACGPIINGPAKIIIGGPMMGVAQYTTEVPVVKSTGGVLLFSGKSAMQMEENACIRCAACVRECPVGLMPCLINLSSEKELWDRAKKLGAMDCIECGCCDYVCPAGRLLVQSIKRAKLEARK